MIWEILCNISDIFSQARDMEKYCTKLHFYDLPELYRFPTLNINGGTIPGTQIHF